MTVSDMNDNPPAFSRPVYTATVSEDIPVGTEVLRVTATDPDEGDNAALRYSLENATPPWAFGVDSTTGSVFTVARLDRETFDSYQLDVRAIDSGKQSESF